MKNFDSKAKPTNNPEYRRHINIEELVYSQSYGIHITSHHTISYLQPRRQTHKHKHKQTHTNIPHTINFK